MTIQRVYKLFPVFAVLATLLVFAPALQNDFVDWDDRTNFILNLDYRGLDWEHIKWMWTNHVLARYVPVTWMTFGVDYVLWGMEPFGYHLTNILFHAANVALFYYLALELMRLAIAPSSPLWPQIPIGALFGAMLFAIHPLRVESVAWITERRDVVSGLFYLLAILAYLRGCRDGPGKPIRRGYYWLTFLFCALAILAKEICVTLPIVLLILDFYPLRRLGGGPGKWFRPGYRSVWLEKIPFFALGLADAAYAIHLGHLEGMVVSPWVLGWMTRSAISIYNLAFYVWKTVLPFHLAPFYAVTAHRVDPHALPFQMSAVLVVLITAAATMFRKQVPALLAVWLAYAAALLPVLGIVNAFKQIVADRYSYLACMGLEILAGACFLVVWNRAAKMRAGRAVAALVAITMVGVLGALSWKQVGIWKDPETFWTYTLSVEPSFLALDGMGVVLAQRGDYPGAIQYLRESIAVDPDYEFSHNNLAAALSSLGNYEEAAKEFEAALALKPNLSISQNGWGYALLMQGKLDEAIEHFRLAVSIDPGNEEARNNLERALALKTK